MPTDADKYQVNKSVTHLSRALKLFTDRHEAIRTFASRLNDNPPIEKILFFQGDGGNGKTLLVHTLKTFYCKRFSQENWDYIKPLPFGSEGESFETHVREAQDGTFQPIPSSLVDFASNRDSFSNLKRMRNELAPSALKFPIFEYAALTYLLKTGQITSEQIKALFPMEEADILTEIVNAASQTSTGSIIKAAVNYFARHAKEKVRNWWAKRGIDEEIALEIDSLDPERELFFELPRYFALDLNKAMSQPNAPKRVALFFDTHEAFWGTERDTSESNRLDLDKWFRYLLNELDLSLGIVVIVAGRDFPRWSEVLDETRRVAAKTEVITVGFLTDIDGYLYLQKAGITDIPLMQTMVRYASVKEDEVHPFYLGLCVDVAIAIEKNGKTPQPADFASSANEDLELKGKELINRLLSLVKKDVRNSVRALSACRSFNMEIYRHLGEALYFSHNKADFELLTDFSFVWNVKAEDGSYRIHDLLRRLFRETGDEEHTKAHQNLIEYYQQKADNGDKFALADVAFHTNQIDSSKGVKLWIEDFKEALRFSKFDLCRVYLDIRRDLIVNTDFDLGHLSQNEGDYFAEFSLHEDAENEYKEAFEAYKKTSQNINSLNNKGVVLQNLGDLQAKLSKYYEAEKNYGLALDSYNQALTIQPKQVEVLCNKGGVLSKLGNLQTQLSNYDEAIKSYHSATNFLNEVLKLDSNLIIAYHNKGNVLEKLGNLQTRLSKSVEAINSFEASIIAYDEAIMRNPSHVETYNNKASVLHNLGSLQVQLSNNDAAKLNYNLSIVACEETLKLAPNYINAYGNKAAVFAKLGELRSKLSEINEAEVSYKIAIDSLDEIIRLAPNSIDAHNNKGLVLKGLGYLQSRIGKTKEAKSSFQLSLSSFDESIRLAPNLVTSHNNKGTTLQTLGDFQSRLSGNIEAEKTYQLAIISLENSLKLAPNYVECHNNKGIVLESLGEIQLKLSKPKEAEDSYQSSISAFDKALEIAPAYAEALNNKGMVLQSLGDLQAQLSKNIEAKLTYQLSIDSYNSALRIAPNYISAHMNKGNTLSCIGDFQKILMELDEAISSYKLAIDSYNESIKLAPNYFEAQMNKGIVFSSLGDLYKESSKITEAEWNYQLAIETYNDSFKIAPNHIETHINSGTVWHHWGKLKLELKDSETANSYFCLALKEWGKLLAIAPNYSVVQSWYAELSKFMTKLGMTCVGNE